MIRVTRSATFGFLTLGAVLAGCTANRTEPPDAQNPSNQNTGDDGVPRVAAMERFASEQEFRDYFTGQVMSQNDRFAGGGSGLIEGPRDDADAVVGAPPTQDGSAGGPAPVPGAPETGDDSFSGTTLQEAGVDEADVVKTDGQYLYILSDGLLRIVSAVPADAVAQIGEYDLEGYGQDMYLFDGRAVVITAADAYYPVTEPVSSPPPGNATEPGMSLDEPVVSDGREPAVDLIFPVYYRPRVVVTVIDVSNPAAPALLSETRFEGSLSSSRMLDGVLHLVAANYPNYFVDILPLGMPEVDASVRAMGTADLLPNFERVKADGSRDDGDVVTWQDLYRPVDPDGFGMAMLISLDVRTPETFRAQGIVADPGLIYSSTEALYITDTDYSWMRNASRTTTNVYKFSYESGLPELVAAGSVEGRVINQYAMSEYQANLRVAATIDGFTRADGLTSNKVYVLAQREDTLTTIGSIDDISPGETLYAARFLGDKGYLVTFRQIDPLITLDLSNPEQPVRVGELHVPGFSTFITPISDTRLLTIGQDVPLDGPAFPRGVKLSIYDVSDFANPRVVADELLGVEENSFAYSEALYNPKAFNYFASPTAGNLLALPIRIETYSGGSFGIPFPGIDIGAPTLPADDAVRGDGDAMTPGDDGAFVPPEVDVFDGLVVYRITDTGFEQLGRVSTTLVPDGADDEYPYYIGYYSSYGRGVFIGETVYAVTDRTVVAAPLGDLDTTLSKVDFPFEFDGGFGGIPVDIGMGGGAVGSGGTAGGGQSDLPSPDAP